MQKYTAESSQVIGFQNSQQLQSKLDVWQLCDILKKQPSQYAVRKTFLTRLVYISYTQSLIMQ